MPNGGYAMENGIALCPDCHVKAEDELNVESYLKYAKGNLYKAIDSNHEKAVKASEKLK